MYFFVHHNVLNVAESINGLSSILVVIDKLEFLDMYFEVFFYGVSWSLNMNLTKYLDKSYQYCD